MPRPGFTLDQVRIFLAVAESQHLTRAAKALHMSQGGVTQQVQNLERSLSLSLFERVGRGIRLTHEGEMIRTAARATLRAAEGIEETAAALRSLDVGSLVIGASPTSASHYLLRPLAAFSARHPGVELKITVEVTPQVIEDVSSGVLDCGMVEGEVSGLIAQHLVQDEAIVVVSSAHPLAHLPRPTRQSLLKHRYLARERGTSIEAVAEELMGEVYSRVARIELGQLDPVRSAAIAGLGFAVLPRVAVQEELRQGALRELTSLGSRQRWINAIRRPEPKAPALEAFWETLTGGKRSG